MRAASIATDRDQRPASDLMPSLTAETRPFFTGGARGELLIARCTSCAYHVHPPAPRCPLCLGVDVEITAVSGRGTVASYTINCYAWHPAFEPPYAVAIVELAEQPGLRLTTRIVGENALDVRVGAAVQVTFEAHDEVWLPLFKLVTPVDPDQENHQ
jgi:uncharacterized OB-fold protein